jgi:mRNA-degrading endonuclease RelE of RelBE toxin-antitoxin system
MLTVAETPSFSRLWPDYWTEEERGEFSAWISANPEAGDVVPATGGVRKVRWSQAGRGKRGGVRVIYYNQLAKGRVWLLLIYAKSARDNLPAHVLNAAREMLEDAQD